MEVHNHGEIEEHWEDVKAKICWRPHNNNITRNGLPKVYLKLQLQEKHQRSRGRETEILPPLKEVYPITYMEFLFNNELEKCTRDVLLSKNLCSVCFNQLVGGMRSTAEELYDLMAVHAAQGHVIDRIVVTVYMGVLRRDASKLDEEEEIIACFLESTGNA